MKSPILFIIFNRKDTAIEVFKEIRKARPSKLYIAADGPRIDNKEDKKACKETRDAILNMIDWKCKLYTLFQAENNGCGLGPYKAISWFFENEEQGIILEDDCKPHPDFFPYCDELLDKYKNNSNITLITGRCNHKKVPNDDSSYFLSALHFCWGWASWRRVWEKYDFNLSKISAKSYSKKLIKIFGLQNIFMILWRLNIYYLSIRKINKDFWDYQFLITTQMSNGYTIVPKVNLISNIGNDEKATHTKGFIDQVTTKDILPLKHPESLFYDRKYDIKVSKSRINKISIIYNFIKNLFQN